MKRIVFGIALSIVSTLLFGAQLIEINNTTGTSGLIMIDKRAGLVRFFNPVTLHEISNLSIDGTPHELAMSPDHKTAYVPNYGDGVYGNNPNPGHTIPVIDLVSRKVRATIDISPYVAPHGMQVDARGILYVVCDISRKLLVIDPQKLTVKAAIDTEGTGHWVAVLPDGSKAYVANKNDRRFVSVIDLRAEKMIAKIPMPNGTQGIVASPKGDVVLAMDFAKPEMAVIDTSNDQVRDVVAFESNTKGAWRAKYSPDGRSIVVINVSEQSANILDAREIHSQQHLLKVGSQPFGIAFNRDATRAFISNHGDGTISVIDLRSNQVTNTFTAGKGIETLSFY